MGSGGGGGAARGRGRSGARGWACRWACRWAWRWARSARPGAPGSPVLTSRWPGLSQCELHLGEDTGTLGGEDRTGVHAGGGGPRLLEPDLSGIGKDLLPFAWR